MERIVKKISAHPYAQVQVEIIDNDTFLVSYTTPVAIITADSWLRIGGLYSATTRRHIGWFMREYLNADYSLAKKLYENNWEMNILTGEIRDL